MKLGYLLLYEVAEAGRDWSLVNNMRMRSLLIKGGRKIPKVNFNIQSLLS